LDEFSLIRNIFGRQQAVHRRDVRIGIGDDAAILDLPSDRQLVVSSDVLCAGIHFTESTPASAIGHKTAAVNFSDLASMGAEPAWILLNVCLPSVDLAWLEAFTDGFFDLCRQYNVQLIGGDTTRGPLALTAQVFGFVPRGKGLLRSGAKPGDAVFVTGSLGDAALALEMSSRRVDTSRATAEQAFYLQNRLDRPIPRVVIGRSLLDLANSAIDISDGLAADLGHILEASGVGASIRLSDLPLSTVFDSVVPDSVRWSLAATGGEDYEICFTVSADRTADVDAIGLEKGVRITRIGSITDRSGLELLTDNGQRLNFETPGHNHFQG